MRFYEEDIPAFWPKREGRRSRSQGLRQRQHRLALVLLIFLVGAAVSSFSRTADADTESDFINGGSLRNEHNWNRWRGRFDRMRKPSYPVNNTYRLRCYKCHFLYQPWLLPAGSWTRVMEGTDKHFGKDLGLDEKERAEIENYLTSYAADRVKFRNEWTLRILKSLHGRTPERISEVPYIKKKHKEIPAEALDVPYVKSISNCGACHRFAYRGDYGGGRIPGRH